MDHYILADPRSYFKKIRSYDHVILFGCGGKGRQAVSILAEQGIKVTAACDNNRELWGKEIIPSLLTQNFEQAVQGLKNFCVIITTTIVSAIDIYKSLKAEYGDIPVFHLCNPFKVGDRLISANDLETHKEDILYNLELLADDISKKVYCATINWKVTGSMMDYLDIQSSHQDLPIHTFFDNDIVSVNRDTVYVDVGAYTGDSVESFLIFSRGSFRKIIAVEADPGNYSALNQFVRYSRIENIDTYHQALWSTAEDKIFYTNSANHEIHFDSSNLFCSVDRIADNMKMKQMEGKLIEQTVQTNTLDCLLQGESPSIIKINALSADQHIILGGIQTLRKCKPVLILEYGVNKEDVFEMMHTIKRINGDYNFYMRKKCVFGDIKTILYCK